MGRQRDRRREGRGARMARHRRSATPRQQGTAHTPSIVGAPAQKPRRPATLHELVEHFERVEALDYEDAVVPARELTYTTQGLLGVPGYGYFRFTDWSRSQLASALGVRFDRWFENADPEDRTV